VPYSDPVLQRQYQNEWLKKRRRDWLAENGPCVDCGSWAELEVDHLDPAVKVTHRVWSWSSEKRKAELAKCVVRCEPCHSLRTSSQMRTRICINGHDKDVVGRDSYGLPSGTGYCAECRRERHRRERLEGRKK